MGSKKEEFEKGIERVQELMENLPPSPPPSTDTGMPENEREYPHTIPTPQNTR